MKILHVYKNYYPESIGGVEQLIHSLSQTLVAEGHVSDVVTTTKEKQSYEYQTDCNQVYLFPATIDKFSCPISLELLSKFKYIAEDYDVLHYHFPWPYADLLHLLSGIKKPSVVTYHSDILKQKTLNILYQPLMRRFFKKVDRIITTSENLLNSSPVLQKFKDKCSVVPIGMDRPEPPQDAKERCQQWQEKFPKPFFLFIGVLRYYKGLHFLLEAAKGVDADIVIAGDGPEKENLLKQAKELELKNVHFLGRISDEDKWALLETCHAVIAPSHLKTEAFCISLLEGLMHGKPLISTELGTGTSFVNTDGLSGIVVPAGEPTALAEAMQRMLNDDEYYELCKQNTAQHYRQFFTGDCMMDGYAAMYHNLLRCHDYI